MDASEEMLTLTLDRGYSKKDEDYERTNNIDWTKQGKNEKRRKKSDGRGGEQSGKEKRNEGKEKGHQ